MTGLPVIQLYIDEPQDAGWKWRYKCNICGVVGGAAPTLETAYRAVQLHYQDHWQLETLENGYRELCEVLGK